AAAASAGIVGAAQIESRPLLRPGDVLETIPGVVISQHSGEGKANQYYLRGFQLDHGTDLAGNVVGEPINLPTHAHGQGYSDINWLLPELVSEVDYKKGPYYADEGDFSAAGAYTIFYRNTIPFTLKLATGSDGYGRLFVADSPKVGDGNLLYALEVYHDDGPFAKPDNYRRLNGVVRYALSTPSTNFNLTALGYAGRFDSSDQIPQRLVADGTLSRFGFFDPTDGGIVRRYAVSTQLDRKLANGGFHFSAYGVASYLDLYSNFTYYLGDATDYYNVTANPVTCQTRYSTCAPGPNHVATYTSYCAANSAPPGAGGVPQPFSFSCGDQREQEDRRFVSGFSVSRSWEGRRSATTLGAALENSNIPMVGLFLDDARVRFPNGTLYAGHIVEREASLFVQSEVRIAPQFRVVGGLRGDLYDFAVKTNGSANAGTAVAGILLPKLTAAYALSSRQELYINFGDSFHSNDGRGVVLTNDPRTHATIDPAGNPVLQVSPLVRAAGFEAGYRFSTPRLTSTVSLWRLDIASELTFNGDAGTTQPGRPTTRRGAELTNYWSPTTSLTFDADVATSSARFTTDPQSIGTGVPESIGAVIAAGATVTRGTWQAALRMRYFGPRTLIEDGSATSKPSLLFNAAFVGKLSRDYRLTFDIFNVFNAAANDIEYFYGSWTPQDATNPGYARNPAINPALGGGGVPDLHFHPTPPRQFRVTLSRAVR
ncbi:MAG: TonB-dependent receptor plug domain-containing protein, partial [Candidatus Eremiobacteraeota bacterium]|nr:TonB-dependent receptor plug domain-containing protein [Candidatus Eremiobacteraeota bacterium]